MSERRDLSKLFAESPALWAAAEPRLALMRVTFSASDFAHADLTRLASIASDLKFDAVELKSRFDCETPQSNAHLTGAEKIRDIFAAASVKISAIEIGSEISLLARHIHSAQIMGAQFIRFSGHSLFDRSGIAPASVVARLISAGDVAASLGIYLLIQNDPLPGSAQRLWRLLDRLNHPSIGCSWNTLAAHHAGDAPAVAIPMLNSRIRYVCLQDAVVRHHVVTPCELSAGDVPIRKTLERLRGIGYDDYLLIEPGDTALDEKLFRRWLEDARAKLQSWKMLPEAVAA